jgi:hypothetical protein
MSLEKSRSPLLFVPCLSLSLTSLCLDLCSSRRASLSRAWLIPHALPFCKPASVGPSAARRSLSPHPRNRFTKHGRRRRRTRAASPLTPQWPVGSLAHPARTRSVPSAGICLAPPSRDPSLPCALSRPRKYGRWVLFPHQQRDPGGPTDHRPGRYPNLQAIWYGSWTLDQFLDSGSSRSC